MTRSLLERARIIGRRAGLPDKATVERVIRQFADSSGSATRFWRRSQPPVSPDEETFERVFEVRMTANELLGVEEHDRILMAPKLLAKSRAMSANRSDEEIFKVRAVSAQIGWLETLMAEAAAQAISNVELLLSAGAHEGAVVIDNQLRIFEAHQHGLLATWETPDALICVPRVARRPYAVPEVETPSLRSAGPAVPA